MGLPARKPGSRAPASLGVAPVLGGKGPAAINVILSGNAPRGRGRIGRGLSEAAEALLGMGGEKVEDDAMVCPPLLRATVSYAVHRHAWSLKAWPCKSCVQAA